MAAQEFYKLKETEKVEVFTAVAQQKGLPVYAVEKDWWVAQTLDIIFSKLEVAEHLLFKGGTSLSKAWHLIQRFSED
ncbi:MAG TPA: nucleotidyl transferase AbiEii/AbiGii toxin family protein, partial [Flavobacteriaceae bacterium]|nr:nucleotidyl transferase AbiEii/AbiGii toxin family protein [Flavobacteriaceae bacterium]